MMTSSLEVNSAYKGVAASWLGLNTNIYSKKKSQESKNKNRTENDMEGKHNNENEKRSSLEGNKSTKQQSHHHMSRIEDTINTYSLIKNKLETKFKHKNSLIPDKSFGKKRKVHNEEDDEESKSSQVKVKTKKNMPPSSSNSLAPSVQELNTRLLDTSLSRKARKRIRKKIAMLTQAQQI